MIQNAGVFLLFLLAFGSTVPQLINGYNGQSTSTTSTSVSTMTTTTTPETLDPAIGGKIGNPGAQIRLSTKVLDSIYDHAAKMIARALRSMNIPDVILPIGGGMLTIRSTRVTEVKIPNYERQLLPPNRIKTSFYGCRIVSVGEWQFTPVGGARSIAQGIFRTVIVNAELNMTNQLARTWDAKPMVQTPDCKAYLGQFRVEIEGFGENTTVIDQCSNLLCQRIRSYFEDAVCNMAKSYVKETVNFELSSFPNRVLLGPNANRFVLDYNLLLGEPKVTDQFIQAYLEGEVLSRGFGSAHFYAPDLTPLPADNQRNISFPISDYVFNTLFYHAHGQQYRFSALDMANSSNAISQLLKLNCSTSVAPPVDTRRFKGGIGISSGFGVTTTRNCLGSVFENGTIGQQPADGLGDLVFKSQRPLAVLVRNPMQSYFGTTGGTIEAYGAVGSDGKRELLGRADVRVLRGDFFPALNRCNITGSINMTDLQLTAANPPPTRARGPRSFADDTLTKLADLAKPILKEMFNSFLAQYAQFPIPLLDGYECASPEFHWGDRIMQIDCDVRVSPEASRRKKTKDLPMMNSKHA